MNMLRMIIADDEYNVREGLKEVVRWGELGIEVVADAADGQEAFELCRELKPDILLTDIRMPMMDGLEAALKLKELEDPVRVIIISGAQDFNYAKTALSLNADGYILKPVKIPELQETVRKVVASISMERNREERNEQLKRQLHENMPLLREKFLSNLTLGMYGNEADVRSKLAFFGLPLDMNGLWTAAVLQIDDYEQAIERYSEEHRQLLNFSVTNVMDEIVSASGAGIAFSMNENEYVVIFNQTAQSGDRHVDICQEIVSCVNKFLKMSISAGIGNPVPNVYELHGSYREAQSAIKYKFYTGKNSVLQIGDFQTNTDKPEYPNLYEAESKLINFMKLGSREEASAMVGDIFETLCANRHLPVDYVQSICVELVNMASRSLYELGEQIRLIVDDHSALFGDIYGKREVSELRDAMLVFFGKLTDYFGQKHTQKNSRTIQKIKDIISRKYMENITVSRLSEEVFLSPNYISLIFKQETGESVTEYMTKVRMEAAKELLKSPDLKILEVTEMVGFENATYFSTVFKKYTGMHPQKYRALFQS
jgi:two-component system response regulator YesN